MYGTHSPNMRYRLPQIIHTANAAIITIWAINIHLLAIYFYNLAYISQCWTFGSSQGKWINRIIYACALSCTSKLQPFPKGDDFTHWDRVTYRCVGRQTITGSDNGLSPGRPHAIIWTFAGILLIWPLGTNFSEKLIEILIFSFTKMRLKVSSAKWRPFCIGLKC